MSAQLTSEQRQVLELEFEIRSIHERLKHGAATFQTLREAHEQLAVSVKPPPFLKTWGPLIVTFAFAIGSWVWFVARMPTEDRVAQKIESALIAAPYERDKARIMRVVEAFDQMRDTLRDQVAEVKLEQTRMSGKLDQLIDLQRGRK